MIGTDTGPGTRVGAIVPCAGRSSRMGTSKALLDADGVSFVRRVVGTLIAGGADPVVVVVRNGGGAEAADALAGGAYVLVNPHPDDPIRGGPISSVREGIRVMPDDVAGVLLHPVDYPRIMPHTVAALVSAFVREGAAVTVPTWKRKSGHPVLFHRALFDELSTLGLPEGARTVVRRHEGARRELPVDDSGVLDDLDTPTDYLRAFPSSGEPGEPT